jgi:hypothetical protein
MAHRGNVQPKELKMEHIKQNYKIVSLVDDRSTGDNGGCPLYHTRLVKAEDGYDEVLKDFKGELDCVGIESTSYDISVDGEDVPWGNEIAGMTLADIEARIGHKPRTYTIDIDGRVTHTLTDIT